MQGNGGFGPIRSSAIVGFPSGTIAPNNSNGDGLVYYNGAANPIVFSGALSDLSESFTANWYLNNICLLYTSPSPRDKRQSRMPSSA